jgi:hypothetical protein
MSHFDVSSFSNLEKLENNIIIGDPNLDLTYLKILFENCLRMGSNGNANIEVASIHPSLWFSENFELFKKYIRVITKTPSFHLLRMEDNNLGSFFFNTQTEKLIKDDEFINFFEKSNFHTLVIFSIVKYIDVKNLHTFWQIRYADISTLEEIRDKKISSII